MENTLTLNFKTGPGIHDSEYVMGVERVWISHKVTGESSCALQPNHDKHGLGLPIKN